MRPSNIVRHSERESGFQHSSGSAGFAAMSLPAEEIALLGATIAGCDLTPPSQPLTVTPPPPAMAKLQRLHAAAAPEARAAPALCRGCPPDNVVSRD
jgi:hypothetical protein